MIPAELSREQWVVVLQWTMGLLCLGVVLWVYWQNARRFGGRQFKSEPPKSKRAPREFPLKLRPGVFVGAEANELHYASFYGWHTAAWEWEVGDYLIIFRDVPGAAETRSTRYRIDEVNTRTSDGWFWARAHFAPRPPPSVLTSYDLGHELKHGP